MDTNTANMDGPPPFDPTTQIFNLTASDGVTQIPVSVADVNYLYQKATFPAAISYSTQLGACFIMLLVVLLMTPRSRFTKWTTLINIASLLIAVIRLPIFLSFYPSTLMEFYGQFTGDPTYINPADFRIPIAGLTLNMPQIMLIEAALIIQAWTMAQLWPDVWKWASLVVSGIFALATVGLKFTTTIVQIRASTTFDTSSLRPFFPVRQADLAVGTANIVWFCFIFAIRLVMHMWTNRSILHTSKGLSAMDALVITNGFLMLVPTVFAGVQWYIRPDGLDWEAGSFVYTTVIIFLPLGSLIAQRLAASPSYGSASLGQTPGGSSRTAKASSAGTKSKRAFLSSFSHHSGRGTHRVSVQAGASPHLSSQDEKKVDPYDLELQRIDDTDECGSGVRVKREVELRHDSGI